MVFLNDPNAIKGSSYTLYFCPSVEGGTAMTGASWSTLKISKDGGAMTTATNTPTEIGNGWYSLVFTSTEMNCNDLTCSLITTTNHGFFGSIVTNSGATPLSLTTALSEITSIPTAGDNLGNKIQAIFQYLFFKRTVTASQEQLYKSDSSTVIGTGANLSDNGTTFTKGAES